MGIKIILAQIAVTILVTVTIGCKPFCTTAKYNLTGGISNFFPIKDSINVGDTLWFGCVIPTKLQPNRNSQPVGDSMSFSGASNVITNMNFSAIPKIDTLTDALDSFILIPVKGSFQVNALVPHGAVTVTFTEEESSYKLSFGIVAKKKGIYCITIIDIYQAEKKCTSASITIPISDTINKHLYFLNAVYFPGSRYEPTIPNSELTHDYCFKVN